MNELKRIILKESLWDQGKGRRASKAKHGTRIHAVDNQEPGG